MPPFRANEGDALYHSPFRRRVRYPMRNKYNAAMPHETRREHRIMMRRSLRGAALCVVPSAAPPQDAGPESRPGPEVGMDAEAGGDATSRQRNPENWSVLHDIHPASAFQPPQKTQPFSPTWENDSHARRYASRNPDNAHPEDEYRAKPTTNRKSYGATGCASASCATPPGQAASEHRLRSAARANPRAASPSPNGAFLVPNSGQNGALDPPILNSIPHRGNARQMRTSRTIGGAWKRAESYHRSST